MITNSVRLSKDAAHAWAKRLHLDRTEMINRYVESYGLMQLASLLGSQGQMPNSEIMAELRPHAEAYKLEHGCYPEYLVWLGFINPPKVAPPVKPVQLNLF